MSEREEGFLARWSRRKIEARNAPAAELDAARPAAMPIASEEAGASLPSAAADDASPALPPLESLTPHSDFAPFMRPEVDPAVKGRALKALFSDPALYAMDGLDVYIDDYTKPDPLPEGWLEKLNQLASLHGEPPAPEAQGPQRADDSGGQPAASIACAAQESGAHEVDTSIAPESQPDAKNRGAI